MNRLSIVILNFNGRHFLEKFLPGVIKNCEGHRVYVVDNGSFDDSYDFLRNNFPGVNVLSFTRNEGFAGGYNMALQQIDSEYYVLLNTDVEVTPGWISPLLEFMESHRDCAACQPKILSYHRKEAFEYAGAAGGFIDKFGYPFCRGRIFNTIEEDTGQYNDSREIFWASGACMLVRSEAFHSAGGFDSGFFAHMEEIDLFWRLKKTGWKVYYISESRVLHMGGGTLLRSNPRKTYLNFRNNLAMLIKNLSVREMIWVLPVRFFFDLCASIKFLIFDSASDSLAVLTAYIRLLGSLGNYWGKRKSIKGDQKNHQLVGFYPKSVLLEYYLMRKKRFLQLGIQ